jgi:DNA-nicking Smr family endonuclease
MPSDENDKSDDEDADAIATPALTDELDLHTFLPKECADVVEEYLYAAQERGMTLVRIIHGKGTGTLRRIVHSVLDRHPAVARYALAAGSGSWGATLVELNPRS